jgi:hypothetical protein
MLRATSLIEPMLVVVVGTVVAILGWSSGHQFVSVGGGVVGVVGLVVLVLALRQIGRSHEAWNRREGPPSDQAPPC